MNTTEAITALRNSNAGRRSENKAERRAANKAFKAASVALWNAWIFEGYPEHVTELLNAYGICLG